MKSPAVTVAIIVLAALLTLPASAQGRCPCDPPEPEPRAPLHVWLPLVGVAQPFAILYPPPLPAMPDKPVRPPTTFLPMVGAGQ